MTFHDLVVISTGNLWRLKLRTLLTVSGITIAIAAFVAMVSFGAGTKKNINDQFNSLGLLTTIHVYPKEKTNPADTVTKARLDAAALERLAKIPGVLLVYPYDAFSVQVQLGDKQFEAKAQSLAHAAVQTRLFSNLMAGKIFNSDSARSIMISSSLLNRGRFQPADSLIGKPLVVSAQVAMIDSALRHLITDQGITLLHRFQKLSIDSLLLDERYRGRVIRAEANEALRRFTNGFMNHRLTLSDTLTLCGVMSAEDMRRVRMEEVVMPLATAQRFRSQGYNGNLTDIFATISSGALFASSDDRQDQSFSRATVNFDPQVVYKPIKEAIEAQGFHVFSYAAQFEEMQQVFIYMNMALAMVGLLALFTASLGIVNTMVMSILERRKEIGVFKSLGADDSEIRGLFLFESGMIGFIGASSGIFFGWIISRMVSLFARLYMKKQGLPDMELFTLPLWLVLTAMAFGIGVAVIAGLYPARRAARVDPVEALRNE